MGSTIEEEKDDWGFGNKVSYYKWHTNIYLNFIYLGKNALCKGQKSNVALSQCANAKSKRNQRT